MPPALRIANDLAGYLGAVMALVVILYCWGQP